MKRKRPELLLPSVLALVLALAGGQQAPARAEDELSRPQAGALEAFETIRAVLQHPRCQNCHIPGDQPLQGDEGRPHDMHVQRGADGHGVAGQRCEDCHAQKNPPPSYGQHMPPGAPGWHLPPPETKMVFLELSSAELCSKLKDPTFTGGKDLDAMLQHNAHDELVLWGWNPGVGRKPVDVPHAEFVAAFELWKEAGAPCPP